MSSVARTATLCCQRFLQTRARVRCWWRDLNLGEGTLMRLALYLFIALCTGTYINQGFGITVSFSPESEKFTDATKEYESIWDTESKSIIEAMEEVSGL